MLDKSYVLSTGESVFTTLVTDVKNGEELKKKVISQELQCCFVTPNLILDTFQIAIAADKAVLAKSRNKLITKNVYSEILFNLSPSKHISKALQKFGSQGSDKNMIVVVIGKEENLRDVLEQVDGTEIDTSMLNELADHKLVEKEYNVKDPETEISSLLNSVITRISAKSFL